MKCQVCGLEYRGEHFCESPVAAESGALSAAPEGFALGYYLRLALRIACWDDAAVREVMNDSRALPYGIFIWSFSIALPVFLTQGFERFRRNGLTLTQVLSIVGLNLVLTAVYGLVQMGICHLFAKYFCGGDGKFIQIVRPLLLAEIVYVLLVIPIAGPLVAPIAWVVVMVTVFHEVHGIEYLSAFLISAGVGLAVRLISHYVLHVPF
jgi:hypothetical protein